MSGLGSTKFNVLTHQEFGLLRTLVFFYDFNITIVIPSFIEVKKFRNKKLIKTTKFISIMNLDLENNQKLINNHYKLFLQ